MGLERSWYDGKEYISNFYEENLLKNVRLEDTEGDVKVSMGFYGDRQ